MLIRRGASIQPVQTNFAENDWVVAFNFNDSNKSCRGDYTLPLPTGGYQGGNAGTGLRFGTADITSTTDRLVNLTGDTLTAVMIIEPRATTTVNNFLFAESAVSQGAYNWGFYEDSGGYMRGFIHNGTTGISTPAAL